MEWIKAGSTSQSIELFLKDSSSSTGAGLTGLAYNTAGLTAYYHRPGSLPVAITLVSQTVTGGYASGGFVEIDGTNMEGMYRLDLPNAALAAGVPFVTIMLKGATNLAPRSKTVVLRDYDIAYIEGVAAREVIHVECEGALGDYGPETTGAAGGAMSLVAKAYFRCDGWLNNATGVAMSFDGALPQDEGICVQYISQAGGYQDSNMIGYIYGDGAGGTYWSPNGGDEIIPYDAVLMICEDSSQVIPAGTITINVAAQGRIREARTYRVRTREINCTTSGCEQVFPLIEVKEYVEKILGGISVQGAGYLGDFIPGTHIRIPFNTRDKSGALCTITNESLNYYKNNAGANDQQCSITVDYDGTGNHLAEINTGAAPLEFEGNSQYVVILGGGTTADGTDVGGTIIGAFSLSNAAILQRLRGDLVRQSCIGVGYWRYNAGNGVAVSWSGAAWDPTSYVVIKGVNPDNKYGLPDQDIGSFDGTTFTPHADFIALGGAIASGLVLYLEPQGATIPEGTLTITSTPGNDGPQTIVVKAHIPPGGVYVDCYYVKSNGELICCNDEPAPCFTTEEVQIARDWVNAGRLDTILDRLDEPLSFARRSGYQHLAVRDIVDIEPTFSDEPQYSTAILYVYNPVDASYLPLKTFSGGVWARSGSWPGGEARSGYLALSMSATGGSDPARTISFALTGGPMYGQTVPNLPVAYVASGTSVWNRWSVTGHLVGYSDGVGGVLNVGSADIANIPTAVWQHQLDFPWGSQRRAHAALAEAATGGYRRISTWDWRDLTVSGDLAAIGAGRSFEILAARPSFEDGEWAQNTFQLGVVTSAGFQKDGGWVGAIPDEEERSIVLSGNIDAPAELTITPLDSEGVSLGAIRLIVPPEVDHFPLSDGSLAYWDGFTTAQAPTPAADYPVTITYRSTDPGAGKIDTVTMQSGKVLRYSYDSAARLIAVAEV